VTNAELDVAPTTVPHFLEIAEVFTHNTFLEVWFCFGPTSYKRHSASFASTCDRINALVFPEEEKLHRHVKAGKTRLSAFKAGLGGVQTPLGQALPATLSTPAWKTPP